MPDVTVVVPTFERRATIAAAVDSALRQAGADLEVVVVDDGSTDGTDALLTDQFGDAVEVVRTSNRGVVLARNQGAAAARGTWLLFLDSDDQLLPGAVAALLAAAGDPTTVPVGAARIRAVTGATRRSGPPLDSTHPDATVAVFGAGRFLVHRDAFDRIGGYSVGLRFGENTDLLVRLVDAGVHLRSVDHDVVLVDERPDRSYGDARAEAARHLLANRPEARHSFPGLWADYLTIAGVDACRSGDLRGGRRLLLRAASARPSMAALARAAAACSPQVARVVWPHPGAPPRRRWVGARSR